MVNKNIQQTLLPLEPSPTSTFSSPPERTRIFRKPARQITSQQPQPRDFTLPALSDSDISRGRARAGSPAQPLSDGLHSRVVGGDWGWGSRLGLG